MEPDPMAPKDYNYGNQGELDETMSAILELAEKLQELSFGGTAHTIERAIASIQHHREEDFWTRMGRAAHAYLNEELMGMPLPRCTVWDHDEENPHIDVKYLIKLPPGTLAAEWVRDNDPGKRYAEDRAYYRALPETWDEVPDCDYIYHYFDDKHEASTNARTIRQTLHRIRKADKRLSDTSSWENGLNKK